MLNNFARFSLVVIILCLLTACGEEEKSALPPTPENNPTTPAPVARVTPTPVAVPPLTPNPIPVVPPPVPVPVTPPPTPITPPITTLTPFLIGRVGYTTHTWVSFKSLNTDKPVTKLLFSHKGSSPVEIRNMKMRFATSNLTFTDVIVVEPGTESEVWLGLDDKLLDFSFYLQGTTEGLEVKAL